MCYWGQGNFVVHFVMPRLQQHIYNIKIGVLWLFEGMTCSNSIIRGITLHT